MKIGKCSVRFAQCLCSSHSKPGSESMGYPQFKGFGLDRRCGSRQQNHKGPAFLTGPRTRSPDQLGGEPNLMMYSGSTLNSTRTSPLGSRNG